MNIWMISSSVLLLISLIILPVLAIKFLQTQVQNIIDIIVEM